MNIHIFIYICVYVYTYVYIYMYTYTYTHMCVCVFVYMHKYIDLKTEKEIQNMPKYYNMRRNMQKNLQIIRAGMSKML